MTMNSRKQKKSVFDLLLFGLLLATLVSQGRGSMSAETAAAKPCEDSCAFKGTAKLKVMGTTNHETISLKFNETGQSLYCSGAGDTAHTISFPYCGPLKYDVVSRTGEGRLSLALDDSWKDSICARHHHLPSKMRKLQLEYQLVVDDGDGSTSVEVIKMTAEVYTVWPLGWKKTTWILHKQPQQSSA
jgi:hypothetical protein